MPTQCDECEAKEDKARQAAAHWELEQWKKRQRDKRFADSGFPANLQGATFDEYDPEGRRGALEAAKTWAKGEINGLLLFGPVGVGKTRLAATAVQELLNWLPVKWVSVPVLLANITRSFGDEDRAKAISVLTETDAIVLDDLDKVKPSEWALAQLFTTIDARVQAGSSLLVTTNLSPNELAKKLGDPIASRLAGYCEVFRLDGPDRRLTK